MPYKISISAKKFAKMGIMTFVAGWAALHGLSGSVFNPVLLVPLIETSLLAGALYALENWRKHRND